MNVTRSNRTTRKSSRFKKFRQRLTLKVVLKSAFWCYQLLKMITKLIDSVKELMD